MSSTDIMRRLGRDLSAGKQSGFLSTLAMAAVFICLFVTLWFSQIVDRGLQTMMSNYRTSIYLKENPTDAQRNDLLERLGKLSGVREARFVSAAQAKSELLPQFGGQALQGIDSNAFPTSIELVWSSPEAFKQRHHIGALLQDHPLIESIDSYETAYKELHKLGLWMRRGAYALCAFAVLCVLAMISGTSRLSLLRRTQEIAVARLSGATQSFIQTPFMIEGALLALGSAALGLGLIAVFYSLLHGPITLWTQALFGLEPIFLAVSTIVFALGSAGLLGAAASGWSVQRFLRKV